MKNCAVLIPAYKPDMRLADLAAALSHRGYSVLVVNDGSGQDYEDVFAACNTYATVLSYEVNRGKGGALKYGFANIASCFPEVSYVITADADGQHTPYDIDKVYRRLTESGGLVIGSRAFTGKVPFRSRFGNTLTRFVFRLASGVSVRDTQSGLRGFSVRDMEALSRVKGNRYEYETAVLLYAVQAGIPISEVEIETIYEAGNPTSHFHPVRDSFRIYRTIYLHSTGLKFITSSVIAFIVDYILSLVLTGCGLVLELSVLIAWICSSLTNFTINYRFSFRAKVSIPLAMGEYYSLAGVVFLLKKYGFQEILVRLIGIPLAVASPICEVIMYPINYIVQKKFIFKKRKHNK